MITCFVRYLIDSFKLKKLSCAESAGTWVAYPSCYRQPEEIMKERWVEVDHSSINRWD